MVIESILSSNKGKCVPLSDLQSLDPDAYRDASVLLGRRTTYDETVGVVGKEVPGSTDIFEVRRTRTRSVFLSFPGFVSYGGAKYLYGTLGV